MANKLDNKKVTAIVPVYNVESYLERCINSLLNQTVNFDEIILIDDGSSDSSGEICDELACSHSTVRVIHQDNAGLGAARNRGIREVHSDYVTFIDSDDWITPDYVETMLDIATSTNAEIVSCSMARAKTNDEFSQSIKHSDCRETYSASEYMDIMLRYKGNRCVHYACAKLFSIDILDSHHFPEGIYNEDVEAFFKSLLRANAVAETSKTMYCYFYNENSITGEVFGENYLCLQMVWNRIYNIAKEQSPVILPKVEYNVRRSCFTILCDMLIHGTIETDIRYETERIKFQKELRHNLRYLLNGPMPIGRKCLATILSFCYPQIRFFIRVLKG